MFRCCWVGFHTNSQREPSFSAPTGQPSFSPWQRHGFVRDKTSSPAGQPHAGDPNLGKSRAGCGAPTRACFLWESLSNDVAMGVPVNCCLRGFRVTLNSCTFLRPGGRLIREVRSPNHPESSKRWYQEVVSFSWRVKWGLQRLGWSAGVDAACPDFRAAAQRTPLATSIFAQGRWSPRPDFSLESPNQGTEWEWRARVRTFSHVLRAGFLLKLVCKNGIGPHPAQPGAQHPRSIV